MAKKVLVTGASGLLGREILKQFVSNGWDALGLAYSRIYGSLRKVDLCDAVQIEAVLDEFSPTVVVHSAAERRPDVVDNQTQSATALNVNATEKLASLCANRNIFLLYISSDYVFDGNDPPYKPDASTNPLNTYGQMKLDGEIAVRKYEQFGVLRIPVLYGSVESLGESAVTTLFQAVLDSNKPAKINDFQRRYPTHVADCAQVCVGLANKRLRQENVGGVWHWSAEECYTKYTMSVAMAEVFGLNSDHLIADKSPPSGAPRPFDCKLDTTETRKMVSIQPTPFKDGIKAALKSYLP